MGISGETVKRYFAEILEDAQEESMAEIVREILAPGG
jgi:hypothetical protein